MPACAKVCPTQAIQFGPLSEMQKKADARLGTLHAQGNTQARLYGRDDKVYGGLNAFFRWPMRNTRCGRRSPEGRRTAAERLRLREIQVTLDQCWDYLNQRRALRDSGRNPDDAQVRDATTDCGGLSGVEHSNPRLTSLSSFWQR